MMQINFLKLTSIFIFIFFATSKVYGSKIDNAENFVKNISSEILILLDKEITVEEKRYLFSKLLNKHADRKTLSRAALGRPWRQLTSKERDEFVNAFQNYVSKKYSLQFEGFKGATMKIDKSIDVGKSGVLVKTRFLMLGSSPISISWQVWTKENNLKLIDIIVEDISMLTMEREEIKNKLNNFNGNTKKLINHLNSY